MVYIQEMFYSIQGEGLRTGIPSIFVRTALCNLRCQGFGCKLKAPDGTELTGCDTIRAVSPKFKDNWKTYIEYEDLVNDINNVIPQDLKNVVKPDIVITGGEPTLYWDDPVFQKTLSYYISRGYKVTIESNGSIPLNLNRKIHNDIIFSLSVKLSNSGEPEHKRINIENIINILEKNENSYLKFVTSKDTWEQDWSEISKILREIPFFANVYFMPMGENKQNLEKNALFVAEKCVELGFNYSDRIHIRLWNDKEGV